MQGMRTPVSRDEVIPSIPLENVRSFRYPIPYCPVMSHQLRFTERSTSRNVNLDGEAGQVVSIRGHRVQAGDVLGPRHVHFPIIVKEQLGIS